MWIGIVAELYTIFQFCCFFYFVFILFYWFRKKWPERKNQLSIELVKNPPWLESLREIPRLLSEEEWKFMSDLRPILKRNIAPGNISNDDILKIKEKTSVLRYDFEKLVDKLKTISSSRKQFLGTFPKWKKFRRANIKELKKIARAVDANKKNCRISKLVGNCVSLTGGGICLAAGCGVCGIPLVAGSAMTGLGSLTAVGASAAEVVLLRQNIEAVKKTIEEDRTYLENLWGWAKDTQCLLESLDDIWSMDINENVRIAAKNLQDVSKRNFEVENVEKHVANILKPLNCPSEVNEEVVDIIGMLACTSMLFESHRPLFDLALEGSRCMSRLDVAVNVLCTASGLNAALNMTRKEVLTHTQKMLVVGCMIIDVFSIVLNLIEVNSKSIESANIRKVMRAMVEEANEFKNLYDKVKVFEDIT